MAQKVDHTTKKLGNGLKAVASAGTPECLVSVSTPAKWVTIQAHSDNTGKMTVGAKGIVGAIATGTGIELAAGGPYTMPIEDLLTVWVDATVSADSVRYLYGY